MAQTKPASSRATATTALVFISRRACRRLNLAWAAQLRLSAKFRRLQARRLMKTKAVVAVARELAGFVWAIGCEVQTSGWQGLPIKPVASQTSAA